MHQKEQEQKQSEQTVVKQARLDRQCVHSEKSSVAFSRSIGMELDSEGFIVSTCTQVTSLISDNVLYCLVLDTYVQ